MLIEDDEYLREHIKEYLIRYRYDVRAIDHFEDVIEQFNECTPHMVLLDINLPYFDGFHLCKVFRKKTRIPIIMISGRDGIAEQALGMELGADDYITKPINLEILLSKIKSIFRRCDEYASRNDLQVKGIWLDEGSFKLFYKNERIELSKNECKLIRKLIMEKDRIVSREDLLEELWDDISFVDDNTLSVNIKRLKDKFSSLGIPALIKTKRGVGYMFDSSLLDNVDEEKNIN